MQRVSGDTGMYIGGVSTNVDDPLLHFYDVGNSINSRVMFLSEDTGKTATAGYYLDAHFVPSTPDNILVWGHTLNGDILSLAEDFGIIAHVPIYMDERAAAYTDVTGRGQ